MNRDAYENRRRRRERVAVSLLSLLILFGLLGGYVLLHANQDQEGKLSLLSTSQVTISVGGEEAPPPSSSDSPEPVATATSQPAAAANRGRGPTLTTDVFGATDQPAASASSKPGASTGASSDSSQPSSTAAPTATRVPGASGNSNTGVLPPGLSLGGTGPGGTGGSSGPPPATSTPVSSGSVASPTPGSQATAAATATAGVPATAVPTSPPPPPTQTPVPEDLVPLGHHSHLHMDGFVAPGAYKAGGIIVSNIGSVAFDYSVSMSVSGDQTFASLLRLRIYLRAGATCDYPGQPDAGTATLKPLTGDQVGTVLYDGTFTTGNKIGDPAAFPAAGDRHLNPGQSEVLCMEVFFPWTAGNEYQGLHVDGTQTYTAKSPDQ